MHNYQIRSTDSNIVQFSNRPFRSFIEHSADTKLWRPGAAESRRVTRNDPATLVVTDFTREAPVTVTQDRPIDDALQDMMAAGVRALLVVSGDLLSGLITSYDVQGERPSQLQRASSHTRHEIEVGQIMTPWDQVPKLDWSWLGVVRVGDIADLFSAADATHVVVVEHVNKTEAFVRALISRTRVYRQLGRGD